MACGPIFCSPVWTATIALSVLAVTSFTSLAACARKLAVCAGPSHCSSQQVCFASQCEPSAVVPVAVNSQRVRLAPTDLAALVSSDDPSVAPFYDGRVTFGRRDARKTALLLQYLLPFDKTQRIANAYLVLQPCEGSWSGVKPVQVTVRTVSDGWDALSFPPLTSLTWRTMPSLGRPAVGPVLVSGSGARVSAIDVTPMVRKYADAAKGRLVLAVVDEGPGDATLSYDLGDCGKAAPWLDVYLQ